MRNAIIIVISLMWKIKPKFRFFNISGSGEYSMNNKNLKPFLKWPGGKRWLFQTQAGIVPPKYRNYIEPFLGGGAAFFHICPQKAILSDINSDLINLYATMKEAPQLLKEELIKHQKLHSPEHYYYVRELDTKDKIQKAGNFLYLNRTCYNGMYRVNRQGKFNVPIGSKENCIYDINEFNNYAKALRGATLLTCDFSETLLNASEGDLIFADPPYAMSRGKTGFLKYNERVFTWSDQKRLFRALCSARDQGAYVLATNVDYDEIEKLYLGAGFQVSRVARNSTIGGEHAKRGRITELVIKSF